MAMIALVWGVAAWVGALFLCRFFALRARNERIWQAIEQRRRQTTTQDQDDLTSCGDCWIPERLPRPPRDMIAVLVPMDAMPTPDRDALHEIMAGR